MEKDYSRDSLLTDFGKATLFDRYMVEGEKSPQDAFARAAKAFADDDAHAQRIYDYASKMWFMYSTPILSNGGTERGLGISCFLGYVPDSRAGLTDHYTETAWLSSLGGGTSGYWGHVRSDGAKTSKGSKSSGSIPFMHVVDAEMMAFHQGGTRRGSYAAYMDISHPEIEEFILMRKPTGGDLHRKNLNLHHGVNITNDFMEAVRDGRLWDLIDPHSKQVVKSIDARYLWQLLMETRHNMGEPYLHFIDTTNEFRPVSHQTLGLKVLQSNLCVAPETLILTDKGYLEISGIAGKTVNVWNGEEFTPALVEKTGSNQKLLKVKLKGFSGGYLDCTEYHKFYTLRGSDLIEKRTTELVPGDIVYIYFLPIPFGDSTPQRATAVIEGVIDEGRIDDTYCFNEPKRHMGVFNGILTGNCSEITLPTNEDRTAVCCLSSPNLEKFDEWKDDPNFLPDLHRFLDNVLTHFIENAPPVLAKAIYSAFRERSLGIGAMGFHSYLQANNIPFENPLAVGVNKKMFKHIREQLTKSNQQLARERGKAPDCCVYPEVRNIHLTAIAPNASSSIICGTTSPGIEPYRANAFNHKTLSGSFQVRNPHLEKVLEKLGKNTDEVWNSIFVNRGSVQHLDFLDDWTKSVFKTAIEIDQKWVIQHAADRQEFIDQAQSLNLFFPADVSLEELHEVHWSAWEKGLKTLYYLRSEAVKRAEIVSEKIERKVKPEDGEEECFGCAG